MSEFPRKPTELPTLPPGTVSKARAVIGAIAAGPEDAQPALEQAPAENEAISSNLLVERTRIGDIELTVALCTHTAEFGAQVAEEIRDCDVLAVEVGDYPTEELQRQDAEFLESQLAKGADRQEAEHFFSTILRDTLESTMLPPLLGSDKKIVLIDIAQEHPAHQLQIEANAAYARYRETVRQLALLEEMQDANRSRLVADNTVFTVRNEYMAKQLRELAAKLEKEEGSAKVGVVVGMAHYGIISILEGNAQDGKAEQIAQRVKPNLPLDPQASRAVGENSPQAEELANRALLAELCKLVDPASDDPDTWPQTKAEEQRRYFETEKRVKKLSTTEVQQIFEQLRDDLSASDQATKLQKLKARLVPIFFGS